MPIVTVHVYVPVLPDGRIKLVETGSFGLPQRFLAGILADTANTSRRWTLLRRPQLTFKPIAGKVMTCQWDEQKVAGVNSRLKAKLRKQQTNEIRKGVRIAIPRMTRSSMMTLTVNPRVLNSESHLHFRKTSL
jgi:hypothetical protein